MQRRQILLGSGAALLPAQTAPATEADWQAVAAAYPLRPGLVYVNAANVCPAPKSVLAEHERYLRDFEADPSFQNRAKFAGLREKSRAAAARLLGASVEELAFTRNTSEATNIIVHGLELNAGEEVVLVGDNHPSNLDSWRNQAQRRKFKIVEVPPTQLASGPGELLDKVRAAFTAKTKVVSITHVTSTTGVLYPAREIAAAARAQGIWCHVDGAQSAGMIDVNLQAIGCDSFATSLHKWMMGPLEAGLLYVRQEQQRRVWPSIVSVGYAGESSQGARAFESYGQRDDARLAAIAAACEWLDKLGMVKVEARVRQLAQHVMGRLADSRKVRLRTNRAAALSAGVVKVDLPGVADLRPLDARLYAQQGMAFSVTASGAMRGIRIAPHIYNTVAQMDQIADALLRA
ncbi:MAG: aminotransferase class V-fold PLP-dependent enzyme [Bryobacter sp.]|nr:aminotransferase class V-fold PLP-dependent enzyme [Bryobacter sp.]